MSILLELKGATIDKVLLKHIGEGYKKFTERDVYSENYKWDILGELNNWHTENKLSQDTVLEYLKYLLKKNPQSGSFTHWSDLDNLNKFSKKEPKKAAELLDSLYNGEGSISERIDVFRSTLDELEGFRIGSSTFGYLFAAFDKDEFPIYKDNMFRNFLEDVLDKYDYKTSGMSIGDKYESYLELCYILRDYFYDEGVFPEKSALYAQDLMYIIEEYDEITKEDIFLKYIYSFSKRMRYFENNTEELLEELKNLPKGFLNKELKKHENSDKIKLIRFQVLEKILNGDTPDMDKIKSEVDEMYEKNILHSWNDHKIIGQIYFDLFKNRITSYFKYFGEYFINNIGIEGLNYHIVTFQGVQNFITSEPWLLVYPEKKGDHRDSYQFFLRILPEKIEHGLSIGQNIEDSDFEEKYVGKITDMDDIRISKIVEEYEKFKQEFIELNGLEISLSPEEIRYSDGVNFWQMSPGKVKYDFWPIFVKEGIAAIGWEDTDDLTGLSAEDIAEEMGREPSDNDVQCCYKFANDIHKGDIIIAKKGNSKEVYGIGVVTGTYYFDDEKASRLFGEIDRYNHFIDVEWLIDFVERFGERIELDLDKNFVLHTLNEFMYPDERENYYARYEDLKEKIIEKYPALEDDFEELEQYTFVEDRDFREVFLNEQDERDARRYFKKLFDYIDYTEDLESILSVTYRSPVKKISVNFGRWKIFSIERRGEDYFANFAVDTSKLPQDFTDWNEYTEKRGTFTAGEDYKLIQFLWTEDILRRRPELKDAWKSAIQFARNNFKDWKRSPYRRSHREDLYDWMVDESEISLDEKPNYFWVTANPKIWNVSKIKDGGTIFYTAYNQRGNKRRIFDAFEMADPGDRIIFYESTPVKKVVAEGEITQGMHHEEEDGYEEPVEGISIKYKQPINKISWSDLLAVPELEGSKPIKNGAQGSLFELTKKEFETILALEPEPEVEEIDKGEVLLEIHGSELDIGEFDLDGNLYFPSGVWDEIQMSIASALRSGKNIIFTGPPGTGKTKIAKKVAEDIKNANNWEEDFTFTTATADWTTFDTIGGYYPSKEGGGLEFKPGLFLSCFKDKNGTPINRWLIIDEINRADIDKAFGQLFSVLSKDSVKLPFNDDEENPISIVSMKDVDGFEYKDSSFYVTKNWRLLATMNTYDKSSLYEMSYAFMRRFAFIDVGVPPSERLNIDIMKDYLKCWDDIGHVSEDDLEKVLKIWKTLIDNNRAIGPAIIKDILGFISSNGGGGILTALKLFVLPQFEGMVKSNQKDIIEALRDCGIDKKELYRVAKERFDIELKEDE